MISLVLLKLKFIVLTLLRDLYFLSNTKVKLFFLPENGKEFIFLKSLKLLKILFHNTNSNCYMVTALIKHVFSLNTLKTYLMLNLMLKDQKDGSLNCYLTVFMAYSVEEKIHSLPYGGGWSVS